MVSLRQSQLRQLGMHPALPVLTTAANLQELDSNHVFHRAIENRPLYCLHDQSSSPYDIQQLRNRFGRINTLAILRHPRDIIYMDQSRDVTRSNPLLLYRDGIWNCGDAVADTLKDQQTIWLYFPEAVTEIGRKFLTDLQGRHGDVRLFSVLDIDFVPDRAFHHILSPNTRQQFIEKPSQMNDELLVSVVIPVHRRHRELRQVIYNLLISHLPQKNYEIIVVDSGYDTQAARQTAVLLAAQTPNITYLLGENDEESDYYASAEQRNAGAAASSGPVLLFLDGDILPGKKLLNSVVEAMRTTNPRAGADICMPRRVNLRTDLTRLDFWHDQITPHECHSPAGYEYWEKFYETQSWSTLPQSWKYVSTYCLAVDRRLFMQAGGFRESFRHYGCEDTELGWRLIKNGAHPQLLHETVYHLPQPVSRAFFRNGQVNKLHLMRKSADQFYRCTLDADVKEIFQL